MISSLIQRNKLNNYKKNYNFWLVETTPKNLIIQVIKYAEYLNIQHEFSIVLCAGPAILRWAVDMIFWLILSQMVYTITYRVEKFCTLRCRKFVSQYSVSLLRDILRLIVTAVNEGCRYSVWRTPKL